MKTTQSLLAKLVSIPSVFPNEEKVAIFIEKYLLRIGFNVERVNVSKNRYNLIGTFGQAKNYLCFYGHMDTVPADPKWEQNPFKMTIDSDNHAHGLGVGDMKGGIAAILETAKYTVRNNLSLKVAFGVDEENISLGSFVLTKNKFFNNVNFIISAESGQIINKNQAFSVNYGRKGRFVIECTVNGITAHAAEARLAVNAINQASILIQKISKINWPKHNKLGRTEVIPYEITSTTDSFSIPDRAQIKFNVLTVPGINSQQVMDLIKKIANDNHIEIDLKLMDRATPYMESYQVDLNNPHIKRLKKLFAEYGVHGGYAQSVADENRFANDLNIPVISLGPVGGGDHTAHEWVNLSSLESTTEVFKKITKQHNESH